VVQSSTLYAPLHSLQLTSLACRAVLIFSTRPKSSTLYAPLHSLQLTSLACRAVLIFSTRPKSKSTLPFSLALSVLIGHTTPHHTIHAHNTTLHKNIWADSTIEFFTSALNTAKKEKQVIEMEATQLAKQKKSVGSKRGDLIKAVNFIKKLDPATPTEK